MTKQCLLPPERIRSGDTYREYLLGSGMPGRYGPVDMEDLNGKVMAIENTLEPLNTEIEIEERIEQALANINHIGQYNKQ